MKTLISIVLSLFAISLFAQKGGGKINQGGGQGTVTNIALTVPSGLVVSGSPITNAGTFAVTNNMSSGVVKSNGVGSSLATSLVNILSETTGTLSVARGGTGLTALGSANQLIRVNSGGTALEYFTPTSSYLPLAGGTMTGNILFSADNTLDLGASGATRPRTGYFGTSVLAPLFNASTGFQIAGAATSGNYLRGNGTNFVSSAIQAGDIPDLGATYWKIGGQAFTVQPTIGPSGTRPMHFQTNGTRRFSIPSSGIANNTAATKALCLTSNDSLAYQTLQSSSFTATVTQSGSDTLQNSAQCYGHFQRVGDVVTFTVRIEVALTNTGNANTVYFSPPVASNYTTAASDVIGTANVDSQGLSSNNTPRQRALLFASTSDDKIGISFDPVASLSYPENRVYISASGSYIIQ